MAPSKKSHLVFPAFYGGQSANTLYPLVDLAIVGRFLGSDALSAASNSGQIILMLYSIGIGLGTGGQVLISQFTGAVGRSRNC